MGRAVARRRASDGGRPARHRRPRGQGARRGGEALGSRRRAARPPDAPAPSPDVRPRGDPGTCQGADRAAIGAGGGSSGARVGPTTGGTCSPRPAPSKDVPPPSNASRVSPRAPSAHAPAGSRCCATACSASRAATSCRPAAARPRSATGSSRPARSWSSAAPTPASRSAAPTGASSGRSASWTATATGRPRTSALLEDVAASVVAELELSEAAAAARREQRIGAAVLDVATDCLIQIDPDGRILSWSPSAERTFGWDPATAVGRSLIDLMAPEDLADEYRTGLAAVVRGDKALTQRVEAVSMHRDGHRMPVEISLTPLGPDTYMACVRDLTDLRAAEERMEVAERRFRALVEHVPATTWSCAYDEAGDYDYVSPQIEQLTGLPAEHFLGSADSWLDAIHPDDRERVARADRRGLRRRARVRRRVPHGPPRRHRPLGVGPRVDRPRPRGAPGVRPGRRDRPHGDAPDAGGARDSPSASSRASSPSRR